MAAITVTATAICAGGDHITLAVTGAKTLTVISDVSDMTDPITDDDIASFLKVICRLGKIGRTNAQLKTLLQAGVTVTV